MLCTTSIIQQNDDTRVTCKVVGFANGLHAPLPVDRVHNKEAAVDNQLAARRSALEKLCISNVAICYKRCFKRHYYTHEGGVCECGANSKAVAQSRPDRTGLNVANSVLVWSAHLSLTGTVLSRFACVGVQPTKHRITSMTYTVLPYNRKFWQLYSSRMRNNLLQHTRSR